MGNIRPALRRRRRSRRGQALAEYALVLSFVSVVAITVLTDVGQEIRSLFVMVVTELETSGGGFNAS